MSTPSLRIFVLNVPEFAPLAAAARSLPACQVVDHGDYTVITSSEPVVFERRALELKPAVWYGLFTGGLDGKIDTFGRDTVRVVPRRHGEQP